MKWINYKKFVEKANVGTDENPVWEDVLLDCGLQYSESNEQIVKEIACNGEYTIEDDGQPDPAETPSQLDVIEAQVTYTAMMTDTLLEV